MPRGVAQLRQDAVPGDLFSRIGAFLRDQRLGPEPEHYRFAWHVLRDPDGPIARAVAELTDDGVRLSRQDIEQLGGTVRTGTAPDDAPMPDAVPAAAEAERLVGEAHAQVEGFASAVRQMGEETRGFGRELERHAAEMLDAGPNPGVAELARITGAMLQRIHEAEARLEDATREADELRGKLAEARVVARRDPLTGLPNRRAFAEAYAASGGRRCLALCDVDRFKRINDGHGHGVGDRVLSAIADTLRVACAGHVVARHGGEEFAVLLSGIGLDAAAALLEGAREGVSGKRFRSRETGELIGRVTLSVGLTAVADGEPLEQACARADRHLYAAKTSGRDRLHKD